MMIWRRLALVSPLVLATSCMVGPNYPTPKSDVAPQWLPSPAASSTKPLNAADAYWWKVFQDPVLDGLVETAYQNNLTLQIAGVRVLAARARVEQVHRQPLPAAAGAVGRRELGPGEQPGHDQPRRRQPALRRELGDRRLGQDPPRHRVGPGGLSRHDRLLRRRARHRHRRRRLELRQHPHGARSACAWRRGTSRRRRRASASPRSSSSTARRASSTCSRRPTLLGQTQAQIPALQNTLRQAKNGLALLLGETPDAIDARLGGARADSRRPGRGRRRHSEGSAAPPPGRARGRADAPRRSPRSSASRSRSMYPSFSLAGRLRLRVDQPRARLARGHVHVAEPRRAGRRLLLLSDLQLRPARQPGARAGRAVPGGGPELPEHGAEGAAGGRGRALRVLHRRRRR